MIGALAEFRRRIVWLWRLASSATRTEREIGDRVAIWIFDTRHAPDGYMLRPHVHKLAERENLRLYSFGPHARPLTAVLARFLAMTAKLASGSFNAQFAAACRRHITDEVRSIGCDLIVVGSARGTFAEAACAAIDPAKIWEVQHGLLDESYFPPQISCFLARSEVSAAILREHAPAVPVRILGHDLDPPKGHNERARPEDAAFIACYSKNPGGGCRPESLAAFERAVIELARASKRPLRLYLHPRDSLLKVLVRHKSVAPCAYVWTRVPESPSGRRLVISSYSTALTTNSACGDLLLNVRLEPLSEIVEAEYGWLPSVDLDQLGKATLGLQMFRRD
jgi:hypothetical protein